MRTMKRIMDTVRLLSINEAKKVTEIMLEEKRNSNNEITIREAAAIRLMVYNQGLERQIKQLQQPKLDEEEKNILLNLLKNEFEYVKKEAPEKIEKYKKLIATICGL